MRSYINPKHNTPYIFLTLLLLPHHHQRFCFGVWQLWWL